MPSKTERLAEIIRRLVAAIACSSYAKARELLVEVINSVENELSGIPYNEAIASGASQLTDGRIYPPSDLHVPPGWENPNVWKFKHTAHDTFIAANGAILIRTRKGGSVIMNKPGADGRRVNDYENYEGN